MSHLDLSLENKEYVQGLYIPTILIKQRFKNMVQLILLFDDFVAEFDQFRVTHILKSYLSVEFDLILD